MLNFLMMSFFKKLLSQERDSEANGTSLGFGKGQMKLSRCPLRVLGCKHIRFCFRGNEDDNIQNRIEERDFPKVVDL